MSTQDMTPWGSAWNNAHWKSSDYAHMSYTRRLTFLNDMLTKAHEHHVAEKNGDHEKLAELNETLSGPPYISAQWQLQQEAAATAEASNDNAQIVHDTERIAAPSPPAEVPAAGHATAATPPRAAATPVPTDSSGPKTPKPKSDGENDATAPAPHHVPAMPTTSTPPTSISTSSSSPTSASPPQTQRSAEGSEGNGSQPEQQQQQDQPRKSRKHKRWSGKKNRDKSKSKDATAAAEPAASGGSGSTGAVTQWLEASEV